MPRTVANSDKYFAAVEPEELGASICARLEEIAKDRDYTKSAIVFLHLYGQGFGIGDGSVVGRKGDDGQLLDVNIKKAKALLESQASLLLGPPLNWHLSASNADVESRGAVLLGSNLLEFFWKNDGFGVFCGGWVKAGLALEESYVFPEWYEGRGTPVGVAAGQLVLAGGLRCRLVQKWDVFFDSDYASYEEAPWVCVRTHENKFDTAALYAPEPPEEDMSGQAMEARERRKSILSSESDFLQSSLRVRSGSPRRDVGPVYRFFHRPTPAVPNGLEVGFTDARTVLYVRECEEIPLERFSPGDKIDSTEGDSAWTSTLGIEDLTDMVESAVASNFDAFGTQSLAMESDTLVSEDRVNNLAVYEFKKGAVLPQGLNHLKQPEGADKYLSQKASDMAFVTGQNDVQLGQPDTAQMNARAFAILKSAAVERNSLTQRRAFDSIGRLGGKILRLLARNMTEEQALAIGGRAARLSYPVKKWSGKDLLPISSCFVEVGNPLEQTAAGRLEILDALMEGNPNMPAEDRQQVIETGRLEQALAPQREESLLISYENDELLDGNTPIVHWAHNHLVHYPKHACLASQPTALAAPQAMKALEEHLVWHYREFWGLPEGVDPKTDPQYFDRVRVMLGQKAPSAVGPPPMGGPSAGAPPQPQHGGSNPPSSPQGAPPALKPPEQGGSVEGEVPPNEVPSVLQ